MPNILHRPEAAGQAQRQLRVNAPRQGGASQCVHAERTQYV